MSLLTSILEVMGKTWVLHTETKGTGAQMVPLERVTQRSAASEPLFVPRKRPTRPPPDSPPPRAPRRFKVVDVRTRQELVAGAPARETLAVLRGARHMIDLSVYVWQEERDRWRLLTLAEQRAMWQLARDAAADGSG